MVLQAVPAEAGAGQLGPPGANGDFLQGQHARGPAALGAGMGQGPALALLLAGPSLSLPSILVIGGELGWKKTLTYVTLVVILSTVAGMAFGAWA